MQANGWCTTEILQPADDLTRTDVCEASLGRNRVPGAEKPFVLVLDRWEPPALSSRPPRSTFGVKDRLEHRRPPGRTSAKPPLVRDRVRVAEKAFCTCAGSMGAAGSHEPSSKVLHWIALSIYDSAYDLTRIDFCDASTGLESSLWGGKCLLYLRCFRNNSDGTGQR
jgi:hypothetical protein